MAIKQTKNKMSYSLNRVARNIKGVPKQVYDYWVSITPIKTGNARSKTKLKGSTIDANYNYAVPLDRGHSKQAPRGMSKPTEKFLKKLLKQKIRK